MKDYSRFVFKGKEFIVNDLAHGALHGYLVDFVQLNNINLYGTTVYNGNVMDYDTHCVYAWFTRTLLPDFIDYFFVLIER